VAARLEIVRIESYDCAELFCGEIRPVVFQIFLRLARMRFHLLLARVGLAKGAKSSKKNSRRAKRNHRLHDHGTYSYRPDTKQPRAGGCVAATLPINLAERN